MKMEIRMPRLGVNDDFVVLAQWLVNNGDKIKKGQKIAIIETTKETSEIVAEEDGYISLVEKSGSDVAVDKVVAVLSDSVSEGENIEKKHSEIDNYRITAKAKKIIEEYSIDISKLPVDKLIKEKDVLALVSKPYEISNVMSNKLLIYGAGGFGKIAADIIKKTPSMQLAGFVDINYPELVEVAGVPVLGNDESLQTLMEQGYKLVFNAVGFKNKAHWRKQPYELLKKKGFMFANIVHPNAIVEESVLMGESNLVCAGAIIGTDARIGSNCIINAGAVISHDCIISDNCHVASGAVLAGSVVVGENTLIGQNCTIYSDVKIGSNVVIQNGCHIFKNVKDGEVVLLGE